jgi:hypothetical protein
LKKRISRRSSGIVSMINTIMPLSELQGAY